MSRTKIINTILHGHGGGAGASSRNKCMNVGLLPVCTAQLLNSVASLSMLHPWRAAWIHGIWKICADCGIEKGANNTNCQVIWSTANLCGAQACMCLGAMRVRVSGSTWSSQLTPGYLPDWICSSSHGLSLSRPGCCMLLSELQVCRKVEMSARLYRSFRKNRRILRNSNLNWGGSSSPFTFCPPLHSSNHKAHCYSNPCRPPITFLWA